MDILSHFCFLDNRLRLKAESNTSQRREERVFQVKCVGSMRSEGLLLNSDQARSRFFYLNFMKLRPGCSCLYFIVTKATEISSYNSLKLKEILNNDGRFSCATDHRRSQDRALSTVFTAARCVIKIARSLLKDRP